VLFRSPAAVKDTPQHQVMNGLLGLAPHGTAPTMPPAAGSGGSRQQRGAAGSQLEGFDLYSHVAPLRISGRLLFIPFVPNSELHRAGPAMARSVKMSLPSRGEQTWLKLWGLASAEPDQALLEY